MQQSCQTVENLPPIGHVQFLHKPEQREWAGVLLSLAPDEGSSLSLRASVRGKELFKPNCISSLRVADQNGFCDENENFKKLQSFSTSSLRKRFWDGPALRHGSTRSLRATHAYEHR